MSKRRQAGEWVWLKPNSGFVGNSHKYHAQIQPTDDRRRKVIRRHEEFTTPCMLDCGDPECREWPNLWTDIEGEKGYFYHVSECQMLDEPYEE